MSGIESLLRSVLAVFVLALLVRLLVRNREPLSFASVLVFVGLLVSILGLSFELASELILAVLLPTIIFQGTTAIDVRPVSPGCFMVVKSPPPVMGDSKNSHTTGGLDQLRSSQSVASHSRWASSLCRLSDAFVLDGSLSDIVYVGASAPRGAHKPLHQGTR